MDFRYSFDLLIMTRIGSHIALHLPRLHGLNSKSHTLIHADDDILDSSASLQPLNPHINVFMERQI